MATAKKPTPTSTGYNPLTGAGPGIATPVAYSDPTANRVAAPVSVATPAQQAAKGAMIESITGNTTGGAGALPNPNATGPYSGAPAAPAPVVPSLPWSASQMLDDVLFAAVGVRGLGSWAANLANAGATTAEIVNAIRYGTDTTPAGQAARAAYLTEFPNMDQYLKNGTFIGDQPEQQYMAYRKTVREAASRYGVNEALVTNDKIVQYLNHKTSAAELTSRMGTAAQAVATTPTETYQFLDRYYGVKGNDLISFYLDPEATEAQLNARYTSARIGVEGLRNQFNVGKDTAEGLTKRGVTLDQAQKGFLQASQERGFTWGKGETINEPGLIEGQFGDGVSQAQIERISAARKGAFATGGGYAEDKSGVIGLTSASL